MTRAELVKRLNNYVRLFSPLDCQEHVVLARAAADMLEADEPVVEALADMIRIVIAHRFSGGLGKRQAERLATAEAILSAARERKGEQITDA